MEMVSTARTGPGWRRNDGIDLLRGLSIVLVLMNHVNMRLLFAKVPYTRGLPNQVISSLVWNGQAGVQIFFVVSGFLITSTSLRRWGTPGNISIRSFYLLRFARIAPLLLVLLTVLCLLHVAHVPGYVVSGKTGGLGRALLAALTFHINLLEATRGYLPGNWDILWSLSVEEMFYLFFPLVARLLPKRSWLIALLAMFLLAGPFARMKAFNPNPVWREYSYFGGMDAIALGCLAAILISGKSLPRTWIRVCGWAGAALLVYTLCFSITAETWVLGRSGLYMSVLAAGAALAIVAATQSEWRAPRLLLPLQILGQRSYEIYLTHMFAVLGLFAIFVQLGKPLGGVPVLFAMAIVSAGLLGWTVAVLFAEPMNRRLRKRFGAEESNLGAAVPEVD